MKVTVRRISRLSKGKEIVKWRVDYTDHSGVRHRPSFDTRKEADAKRDEISNQLRTGTFRADAHKKTVRELAVEYLEYLDGRLKRGEQMTRGSHQFYVGHLNNYILATPGRVRDDQWAYLMTQFDEGIGEYKLLHLTSKAVGDFRDRLRNAGLSVITTRKVLVALSAMMAFAKNRDYVSVNPVHGVKVIGPRNETTQLVDAPSKEDLEAVIQEASPRMALQIKFSAATGIRAGEMHALRWGKINFEDREVIIDTRLDKYGIEDGQGTKSRAGNRTIPLGTELVTALLQWRTETPFPGDEDPVFPNVKGRLRKHSSMLKYDFFPIFDRLNAKHLANPKSEPMVKRFRWHALRHYAISCWIEAGLPPKVVQKYAGHSTLALTMDRYTHVFKSTDHHNLMDQATSALFSK
jgi:integrase